MVGIKTYYLYIVDTKQGCILECKTTNKNIIYNWNKIAEFNGCNVKDSLYFVTETPINIIRNINDFNYEQLINIK